MGRQRDYRKEYERRIARGIARGLSRSQARGHPGIEQSHVSRRVSARNYDDKLEEGVRRIREGSSLTASAAAVGVSRDRLRRYVVEMGIGVRERGRWQIGNDRRPRRVPMYSEGRAIDVVVPGYGEAAEVGRYMAATAQFQRSNDQLVLEPYRGNGVRDWRGQFHPYETDPNQLYRLLSVGPEPFEQIYRIVV